MNPYYKDYAQYLAERFDGKVQKISVNVASSCPNRDGAIGHGGCIYCNNLSFTPQYRDTPHTVSAQIEAGKAFFARKYPDMRYLAYFQSYTNTHGDTDSLMRTFREAAYADGIAGIIIGTRPDCMPDSLLNRLAELNLHKPVIIEYGAESSHDSTLALINRCHTWAQTCDAVLRTAGAGIDTGLHFILGLPGETHDMMLETIRRMNVLPVSSVKFHQLQVIRDTPLASMVAAGRIVRGAPGRATDDGEGIAIPSWTPEEYAALCAEIVRTIRPDIAIDRFISQAPPGMVIHPRWAMKNYQFTALLTRLLADSEHPQPSR